MPSPRERQALLQGARAAALTFAVAVAAAAPSRWVLSGLDESPRWQPLLLGLAADMAVLWLPCAITAALLLLIRRGILPQAVLAALAVALWLFMVTATESSLSRGVFPSWVDLFIAWQSPATVQGSQDMFLLRRNLIPAAAVVLPLVALLCCWPRPGKRRRDQAAGALIAGACLGLVSLSPRWLVDREVATPLAIFTSDAWSEAAACALGPCEPRVLLAEHETSPALQARGAAILGWPPPKTDPGAPHPFARPLPAAEAQLSAAAEVLARLDELSKEIFETQAEPIHVWQIALEGVRGDDLHGVSPAAPRCAAPFLAELYDQAGRSVIASRRTWTAGLRTPHGVAALTCGLGTLPYGLTLTRDLPSAPLRCLPDVLAAAGFTVSYGYGGAADFDRMDAFLTRHSFEPAVTLPPDAAQGAWGASDRAVFSAVAKAAVAKDFSYHLVLSLSHHHPFTPPEDTPPEVRKRAAQAFAQATVRAAHEDQQRLVTLAYTDYALQELFAELAARGLLGRSIVAITADHPIPDRSLWRHRPGALSREQTLGLIPFVLWLSPELLDAARNPERTRSLTAKVNRALDSTQLSQNDIPTLLLALLAHAPPLSSMDPGEAWHTLGGQATSPHYVGPRRARIHGIHAATALYFIGGDGYGAAPDEPATLVITRAKAQHVTPSIRPAGAVLRKLIEPGDSSD